jgi:hypothetical protein
VTTFLNGIPWRDLLARPAFEAPPIQALNAGSFIGSALTLRLARFDLPALLLAALHSATEAHDLCDALAQSCSLVPDFHPSQSVLALSRPSGPRACV